MSRSQTLRNIHTFYIDVLLVNHKACCRSHTGITIEKNKLSLNKTSFDPGKGNNSDKILNT